MTSSSTGPRVARALGVAGVGVFVGEFVAKDADTRPDIVQPRQFTREDFVAIYTAQANAMGRENGFYPVAGPTTRRVYPIPTPAQLDVLERYWRAAAERVSRLPDNAAQRAELVAELNTYIDRLHAAKVQLAVRDAHKNPLWDRYRDDAGDVDVGEVADVAIGFTFEDLSVQRYVIQRGRNLGINGVFLPEAEAVLSATSRLAIGMSAGLFGAGFFESEWKEMWGAVKSELPNVPETIGRWAAKAAEGGALVGASALGGVIRGLLSELGVPLAIAVGGWYVVTRIDRGGKKP